VSLLTFALHRGHQCSAGHPVFEAAKTNQLPAVEFLLRRGFQVDELCCGRRPLHCAIQNCMTEGDIGYQMAEVLLKNGARPEVCSGDDVMSPSLLHGAAQRCCAASLGLLLAHGADPNQANARGDTPLHVACRQAGPFYDDGFLEKTIGLLLRYGANPVKGDAAGLAPVIFLPKHHLMLRNKFARAERWWAQRDMKIFCGYYELDRVMHANSQCASCFTLPEVASTIMSFL